LGIATHPKTPFGRMLEIAAGRGNARQGAAPKTLRGAKTLPARTEVIVTGEQHSLSLLLVIIHFGSGFERWGAFAARIPTIQSIATRKTAAGGKVNIRPDKAGGLVGASRCVVCSTVQQCSTRAATRSGPRSSQGRLRHRGAAWMIHAKVRNHAVKYCGYAISIQVIRLPDDQTAFDRGTKGGEP
jgi:hypothetical protein